MYTDRSDNWPGTVLVRLASVLQAADPRERVAAAIGRMDEPGFWEEPRIRTALLGKLPGYRLSKFQDCLPEAYALETVERYLLSFQR